MKSDIAKKRKNKQIQTDYPYYPFVVAASFAKSMHKSAAASANGVKRTKDLMKNKGFSLLQGKTVALLAG